MTFEPARIQPAESGAGTSAFARTEEAWDIYRLLVENTCDLVGELDAEGEYVYVNPSYQKSLGYGPVELLRKSVFDFIHPQDLEKARRELRREDGTLILRFRDQHGAWKWFDCSFSQFQTPLGYRTVLISRDFGARKESEIKFDVLAALGSRLSSAKSQAEAARIVADAAQTLCGWHAFTLDLYDSASDRLSSVLMIDEVDGRPVEIPPEENDQPPSNFARSALRNGPQRLLRKGNDFDSELRPFGDKTRASASLLFVPITEGGGPLGLVSIQSYHIHAYTRSDLNLLQALAGHCAGTLARIRVADELRATQARFEAFMENTPGAAWIKDEENRYVFANQAIESLFHKKPAEILAMRDLDFLPPPAADQMREQDQSIRQSGEPSQVEDSLVPGDPRHWFVCRFPFASPTGGSLIGGLAFDISNQVELRRSLRASEARFRALFEASPVGIGLALRGELLFTNFAYRQMFDLPAEAAAAGRPFL